MTYGPEDPIFPPGFPEEYKEQILAHRAQHLAHTQDNTHAVRMLLEDLSQDHLKALDLILVAVMEHPDYNGAYFRGQITQLLHIKHDVCPCGLDHDPTKALQLPEITRPGAPEQPNQETELKGRPIEDIHIPDLDRQVITTPDNEIVEIGSERWDQLLSDYTLLPVWAEGGERIVYLQCTGCGAQYFSIQDRMLKPAGPEGCDGCIQKEKWG